MANNIFGKLRELGYKTCPEDFYTKIDEWKQWYDGDVKAFHHYRVYNGQKHINCDRYGLGMAKKVCEDWANLLMNEKVKITLEGDAEQEFFDEVCKQNSFEIKASELEELTFYGGTSAIVVRAVDVPINAETGSVTVIVVVPPTDVEAEVANTNEVHITWTAAAYADSYNIYREDELIANNISS